MCQGVFVVTTSRRWLGSVFNRNIIRKDNYVESYENMLDENLVDQYQWFEILTTPTKSQEKPKVELKILPRNLRYNLLDRELNHSVILNVELR